MEYNSTMAVKHALDQLYSLLHDSVGSKVALLGNDMGMNCTLPPGPILGAIASPPPDGGNGYAWPFLLSGYSTVLLMSSSSIGLSLLIYEAGSISSMSPCIQQ